MVRDFDCIFKGFEEGTIAADMNYWWRPVFCPPNGCNTKTNRALVEATSMVNCLLIKFVVTYPVYRKMTSCTHFDSGVALPLKARASVGGWLTFVVALQ